MSNGCFPFRKVAPVLLWSSEIQLELFSILTATVVIEKCKKTLTQDQNSFRIKQTVLVRTSFNLTR